MDRILFLELTKEKQKIAKHKQENFLIATKEIGEYEIVYVIILESYLSDWDKPLTTSFFSRRIPQRIREEYTRRQKLKYIKAVQQELVKQIKAAENPNFRYHHTSLVQDHSMEKWLRSIEFAQAWHDIWNIPYFSEYHDAKSLEFMLQYVPAWRKLYHVIVIGFDPEIKMLIEYLAKRVKSLRFLLSYMPRDFEELQEDIYDEYGLMLDAQIIATKEDDETTFKGMKIKSIYPCLIIDYSGENYLSVFGAPEGSIWFDMHASEEKTRSIEDRKTRIESVSVTLHASWFGAYVST